MARPEPIILEDVACPVCDDMVTMMKPMTLNAEAQDHCTHKLTALVCELCGYWVHATTAGRALAGMFRTKE